MRAAAPPRPPGGTLSALAGRPCPYCREAMLPGSRRHPTRDHLRPRSRGGGDSAKNKLVVCAVCNGDKSSLTLSEFHAALALARDPRERVLRDLLYRRAHAFEPRVLAWARGPWPPRRRQRSLAACAKIYLYLCRREWRRGSAAARASPG